MATVSSPSSSSSVSLEDLEKEFLGFLTTHDSSPFCCCHLLDSTLSMEEHTEDCELRLLNQETNVDKPETPDAVQRRKHRETVARLRQKMRSSIMALKIEEQELEQTLRETVASASSSGAPESALGTETLRLTYLELVREQLELRDERSKLESTQHVRERYARLVQREIEKARTVFTQL